MVLQSFTWQGFFCHGNPDWKDLPRTALLCSRQSKQPTGDQPWVTGVWRACQEFDGRKGVLATSIGNAPWEFAAWAAGSLDIPQILLVPAPEDHSPDRLFADWTRELDVAPELCLLIHLPLGRGQKNRRLWQAERDRVLVELCTRLVPISIRPGGNLEDLLAESKEHRKVDRSWQTDWSLPARKERQWSFDLERIRTEIDPVCQDHLIHWTRACEGPWPGETRASYYRAVAESRGEYPRSARATLRRMVSEGRIRGSSWRIRDHRPVVAMTALSPSRSTELMRWRRRYSRYSIEPSGIAISRKAAGPLGIAPVRYVESRTLPDDIPGYLCQAAGERGDWPAEMEYRLAGDLWLRSLDPDDWQEVDLSGFLK